MSSATEEFRSSVSARSRRRALIPGRSPLGIYGMPLLLLVLWQVLCSTDVVPATVTASPLEVADVAVHLWTNGTPSTLGENLEISLARAAAGLALGGILGVVAGSCAALTRTGEQLFNGPVQILQALPFLAVLPLFIMWFGIGEMSKILMISLGAFLPLYMNLFGAIRNVDPRLVEMARAAGAGRWRVTTTVILPGAVPGGLVGLRQAIAYTVLGLVVAEQVNADSGIGFMVNQAQMFDKIDVLFLGLAIYAILGLAGDQLVRLLERYLLRWRPRGFAEGR